MGPMKDQAKDQVLDLRMGPIKGQVLDPTLVRQSQGRSKALNLSGRL